MACKCMYRQRGENILLEIQQEASAQRPDHQLVTSWIPLYPFLHEAYKIFVSVKLGDPSSRKYF